MRNKNRASFLRSGRFWIGIAISLVCLWLAFRTVPFADFAVSLAQANYIWLLPAIILEVLSIVTRAKRWMILLDGKATQGDSFWIQNVGYLFNNILPFRLGEFARVAVMSQRSGIHFVQVGASVVIERLLDVGTVVLAMVVVLPWMQVPPLVVQAGVTLGVIVLSSLFILFIAARYHESADRILSGILKVLTFLPSEKIKRGLDQLRDGVMPLTRMNTALQALGWSIVSWGISICFYLSILISFQRDASLVEAIFVIVALAFSLTVPSSPGYIGVFQLVGQQALVVPFGGKYDPATALAAIMTAYLIYYFITTGLGLIGLWRIGWSITKVGDFLRAKRNGRGVPRLNDDQ